MASNLACVGLAVADHDELDRLVAAVLPGARLLGRADGIDVLLWEDSNSGARLMIGVRAGHVVDLLPSVASSTRTRLRDLRMINDEVATAAVVDEHGEQLTSIALELEQRHLVGRATLGEVDAAVVACGVSVVSFPDEKAFSESRESLLDSNADTAAEPPEHFAERGWTWPPKMAAQSFFSPGVFAEPAAAQATARLYGIVSESTRRTTAQTGQTFIVARVRTVGFEVDVCLSAGEHEELPEPGAVLGGHVCLVGSVPGLATRPGRWRRWSRRS